MLAIVQCLVVIGVQEALEDLDRLPSRLGRMQVPVLLQQVFVAGSNITAARITHVLLLEWGQPSAAASISSNSAQDSAASSSDTFWIA